MALILNKNEMKTAWGQAIFIHLFASVWLTPYT